MKNFTLFFFLFCLFNVYAEAQAPTVPASALFTNLSDGNALRLNWTSGNGARRIVIARAGSAVTATPVNGVDYNANSSFGSGDAILAGQFVIYDATSSFVDINNLTPATTYHFAVYEYNGTGAATQYIATAGVGNGSTVSAPTTQATNVLFSNITGNSMRLDWTNGNGQSRLVIARAGTAVNANPVDLTNYSAVNTFGSGTQIGTGNFAVYDFSSNNVTITNLQPNTTYHYALHEFNGSSGPVYLIPGTVASFTTAPQPTVAASGVFFNILEGNMIRMNWVNGNGARRIVVARAGSAVTAVPVNGVDYNFSNTFGSGDDLGSNQYVVFDGTSTFVDITALLPNTVYHFRVYEYDGTGSSTAYLTSSFASASQSTLSAPGMQATNMLFSNVSGSTLTVSWTNGNGARRIIVARAGGPVNADPVNLTSYSPSTVFGSGSQIGTGNYVVFNSSVGSSVNLTGLSINTTYHFAVYEANGNSGPVYLVPGLTGNVTTPAQPTIAASGVNINIVDGGSMRVNWTNGNGARRIVVARQGSAVTALPADGTDYNSSVTFGSGDAITPGQFVVFDGTSSFVDVAGLQPSTTYHFAVFEYNGTGATTTYLVSTFPTGSQATLSAPTVQASNISFSNISGSNLTVNWTNGNGSRRIVVARQGSAVNSDPVNLTFYSASPVFGSGNQVGAGNYTVFSSTTGTSVNITGLLASTTYHFAIYEANGSSGPVYLLPGHTGNVSTAPQPTIAATNMTFSSLEGNSMRVNWVNGNGARRIVVARQGSAVSALPSNGTDYTASSTFGSGDAMAAGQFVIFDGTNTFVDLSGLLPSTVYHFAVFEYDGTGSGTTYLTSSFLASSQSTITAPTLQTSNLTYTSVAATSMTVNWTVGNGARRIVLARQGSPVNADPVNLMIYSGSSAFGTGTQIGTGNYVVYHSNGSNFSLTGLISGTTYHFAVYESNGNSGPVYLVPGLTGSATTIGAPQTQATNAAVGAITSSTMQINWTNGSGNRRLVLMKQGSAVDANPVNNTAYSANSFFGSGTQLGTGNYVVYDATGSSVTVTGLQSNTSYHFAVFEYNWFSVSSSQFLITNPARGNATTPIVLPVNFIGFKAISRQNNIQLEWSTAQEQNSSHFEIEKSRDGIGFTSIGSKTAAGNSTTVKHYSFTDNSPFEGTNYYRLKQTDIDGHFIYSAVVHAMYKPTSIIKRVINPVFNSIDVELTQNGNGEWRLYDMNGKLLKQRTFTGSVIRDDASWLTSAMYLMEVRINDKAELIKIIKQ